MGEIHKLVKDSSEALKVSKVAITWKSYVDFVNNIIIEGFVSAVAVSLQYLCKVLDLLIIARHEMQPLLDIKIELTGKEIVFEPPFSAEVSDLALRYGGWLAEGLLCDGHRDATAGQWHRRLPERDEGAFPDTVLAGAGLRARRQH